MKSAYLYFSAGVLYWFLATGYSMDKEEENMQNSIIDLWAKAPAVAIPCHIPALQASLHAGYGLG